MAVDLTELYKQRNALNQQIEEAQKQAREAGETVIIDGKEYDSTMDFEGLLPNPVDTDYFPTYRKDDNGDITNSGEITYADLIKRFGAATIAEVEDAKDQAISTVNDSVASAIEEQVDPKIAEIETKQQELDEKIDDFNAKNPVGFIATVGDGTNTEFTVTHNLGTTKFLFQVWSKIDDDVPAWNIQTIDANSVKITFDTAPASNGIDLLFAPIVQITDVSEIPWANVTGVSITPDMLSEGCYMTKEQALAILNETTTG